MRKTVFAILIAVVCSGQICVPAPTPNVDEGAAEELIFTNTNVKGVVNNPTAQTTFTINQAYTITRIRTYHWNGGQGTAGPGTVSLLSATGTYGPWSCTGVDIQGGAPNAYWDCFPNVELPAGTYTITDSDTATWSNNADSDHAGIAWVYGRNAGGGTNDIDLLALVKSKKEVTVQFDGLNSYADNTVTENSISVNSDYGGGNIAVWPNVIYAPITWNGNTFTVNHQNSTTTDGSDVWTENIQITGTLSADGRSISNWEALSVSTSDQHLLGAYTTRDYLKGTNLPIPYRQDSSTMRIVYEVTGPDIQNYLQTAEYSNSFLRHIYTGTDYNSTTFPPILFIMFSPQE